MSYLDAVLNELELHQQDVIQDVIRTLEPMDTDSLIRIEANTRGAKDRTIEAVMNIVSKEMILKRGGP